MTTAHAPRHLSRSAAVVPISILTKRHIIVSITSPWQQSLSFASSILLYYYWGKENRSLYRGLRCIEDRYFEVPLHPAWHVELTHLKGEWEGEGEGKGDRGQPSNFNGVPATKLRLINKESPIYRFNHWCSFNVFYFFQFVSTRLTLHRRK